MVVGGEGERGAFLGRGGVNSKAEESISRGTAWLGSAADKTAQSGSRLNGELARSNPTRQGLLRFLAAVCSDLSEKPDKLGEGRGEAEKIGRAHV